ncbi:MAG: glycoside hydrolase family 127 protein, partial [Clostridia bacterium]|nr:glycoside hydrolase family 127 protein [Clostridia bacterium]
MLEKSLRPAMPAPGTVRLEDDFFGPFMKNIAERSAPDILRKFEAAGALENYRRLIAGESGRHDGPPWFHGLICECIRGISDLLVYHYDEALDRKLDEYAALIDAASRREPDGYFNPYVTLLFPERRFGRNGGDTLSYHDTYNAGCLAEAGVHHYLATGKTVLLASAVRNWNFMSSFIGAPPRHNVTSEHSMAEEALFKLAEVFEKDPALSEKLGARPEEYRRTALYLIDSKGDNATRYSFPPFLGEYSQDHRPAREQRDAVGHAVRAVLFYTGLATAADALEEESLAETSYALWKNVTGSKLHVNGCVGAIPSYERFGRQYELPNRGAYLETCAGIGFAFWGLRLFHLYPEARILDEVENTLCNLVPASVGETFDRYTYENPLEVTGNLNRWSWHGCPCCPPMLLKIAGMLPQFFYALSDDGAYVNLYADSTLEVPDYVLTQRAGKIRLSLREGGKPPRFLRLRIPRWARDFTVRVNGRETGWTAENGFARLEGLSGGDEAEVSFRTPVVKYEAHPFVEADRGLTAVRRGPVLYAAEGIDNPFALKDDKTLDLTFDADSPLETAEDGTIRGKDPEGRTITLIPYRRWNNRDRD